MKTSKDYLEEAKAKGAFVSDNAFAKRIGVSRQNMSQLMSGQKRMGDYTAVVVAQILDIDPLEVIAAANHEREKDEKRRKFWEDFRRQSSRAAAAGLLAVIASWTCSTPRSETLTFAYSESGNYQNRRRGKTKH